MLPAHRIRSISHTVVHGHESYKISVGERLCGGLRGYLRRALSSSLISHEQLWRNTSTLRKGAGGVR